MPFSDAVRKELCTETGGFCANPDCQLITGPFVPGFCKPIGDGAHIVSERPDGPRGQSPLTPNERAMASNGVWLCPNCHRMVDVVRPKDYSIALLQEWKVRARIFWQQNQGKPLQNVAQPATRSLAARPSVSSLQGATSFWQAHQSLIRRLQNLRSQQQAPFEYGVVISDDVENEILYMSSSPTIGKSWLNDWSTIYHCDDQELSALMLKLIDCTNNLQCPLSYLLNNGPRRVNFRDVDGLARAIIDYINAHNSLGDCLEKNKNWRL